MRPKRKSFTLTISRPLEEVWEFFSRPENLNEMTPEHVSFNILSPIEGQEMYQGMIIQYQISPILNIPMNWVTEITQIRKHEFFIDDQRVGPYALWHHQHHFKAVEGGTEMTDILHYQVPFGPIGAIANWLFVERMVGDIFKHREAAIEKLFPST